MSGIPYSQLYIPCSALKCETFQIDNQAKNLSLSVIAGHFGVTELEQAGIAEYDCLFSLREPIDRAISCLKFFYGDLFKDVKRWSSDLFRQRATESAVSRALCHNDAARMLTNFPGLNDQAFLKASEDENTSKILIETAISTLRRCVVVDLHDVTLDEDWRDVAPQTLSAWFPWLNRGQALPWAQHSDASESSQRLPHRLIKEIEKLNKVDMAIYKEGLRIMRQQSEALVGFVSNYRLQRKVKRYTHQRLDHTPTESQPR